MSYQKDQLYIPLCFLLIWTDPAVLAAADGLYIPLCFLLIWWDVEDLSLQVIFTFHYVSY